MDQGDAIRSELFKEAETEILAMYQSQVGAGEAPPVFLLIDWSDKLGRHVGEQIDPDGITAEQGRRDGGMRAGAIGTMIVPATPEIARDIMASLDRSFREKDFTPREPGTTNVLVFAAGGMQVFRISVG
jgi:hypothetical protein